MDTVNERIHFIAIALIMLSLIIFVCAWVLQFIGH
jgi:uncharacterized membrane protein YGL010W